MELNDIIKTLSNSINEANQQIAEKSRGEIGYVAVDFSISFPAEFKIEDNKSIIKFVDMKTQVYSVTSESTRKKRLFGLFDSEKKQESASSNVAMINITLKPMPH